MKHCIIIKFKQSVSKEEKDRLYPEIKDLFDQVVSIPGIDRVDILKNVIDRENRYDAVIMITMTPEALTAYDVSEPHIRWKSEYGHLLESKAIIDLD